MRHVRLQLMMTALVMWIVETWDTPGTRATRSRSGDGCIRRHRHVQTSELERLYRDVRCGGFHPANSAIAREVVAKIALGVLGESVRW